MDIDMSFKEGNDTNLSSLIGKNGEPIWTSDTHRFFIGDSTGALHEVAMKSLIDTITTQVANKLDSNKVVTTPSPNKALYLNNDSKFDVDITGNAETATKLKNPVTINGQSFDGSSNISIPSTALNVEGNTSTIQLKRNTKANLGTLASGEPAVATDILRLLFGSASGNIEVPNINESIPLYGILPDVTDLNNVTVSGIYKLSTNTINIPTDIDTFIAQHSILKVFHEDNALVQELTTTNFVAYPDKANVTYRRVSFNGITNWSSWKRVTTNNELQGNIALSYQNFPSGIIIKWGYYGASGTSSFSTPFPTACMAVIVCSTTSSPSYVTDKNAQSFSVGGGGLGYFIAIGY